MGEAIKDNKSKNLKQIEIIDKNGNKKKVFVDEHQNIIKKENFEYEEEYIDNNGNKCITNVQNIKKDEIKKMQISLKENFEYEEEEYIDNNGNKCITNVQN